MIKTYEVNSDKFEISAQVEAVFELEDIGIGPYDCGGFQGSDHRSEEILKEINLFDFSGVDGPREPSQEERAALMEGAEKEFYKVKV